MAKKKGRLRDFIIDQAMQTLIAFLLGKTNLPYIVFVFQLLVAIL